MLLPIYYIFHILFFSAVCINIYVDLFSRKIPIFKLFQTQTGLLYSDVAKNTLKPQIYHFLLLFHSYSFSFNTKTKHAFSK